MRELRQPTQPRREAGSCFSLRSFQFCFLRVWADPGLGPPGGDRTEAFSRGLSPHGLSVVLEAGSQMFGVHGAGPSCGPGRRGPPWLTSRGWEGCSLSLGFSPRSGVGWESTCAGVRVCRKLLDPSPRAGEIPGTPALQSPNTHACGGHPGAGFLGPSRRSHLAGCVTRVGHSPSLGLSHLMCKEGSDHRDYLSPTACPA